MRKLVKILIPIIFVSIIIGGIYFSSLREEETTFEPEYVTFPFSWEEDDEGYLTKITGNSGVVRITIANITSFGKTLEKTGLSWKAEEGYQYFGVYTIGKNLLNEEWWTGGAHGYVGTYFEMKTNRTNLYKPKPLGDVQFGYGGSLKPEEQVDGWVYFEIREDEEPIELRHYEVINPDASWEERKLGILYIWEIE